MKPRQIVHLLLIISEAMIIASCLLMIISVNYEFGTFAYRKILGYYNTICTDYKLRNGSSFLDLLILFTFCLFLFSLLVLAFLVLLLVGLLLRNLVGLLLEQWGGGWVPVLAYLPLCSQVEFSWIIIYFLGLTLAFIVAGCPLSVAVAVVEEAEIIIPWIYIEEIDFALF